MDGDVIKKSAFGLGLYVPRYRKVKWPDFHKHPAIGRFEAAYFDPAGWKNDYPNPAFVRMTDRDGFWAAKILMRFSPEELKAIVATGMVSDAVASEYVHQTLVRRQQECGKEYLNRLNPLDEFGVSGSGLEFTNLAEAYGFASPGAQYWVEWFVYDNASGRRTRVGDRFTTGRTTASIPPVRLEAGDLLLCEIRTKHMAYPSWDKAVGVYLRPRAGKFQVVGIERESAPPS
jgi:hypothetical protein